MSSFVGQFVWHELMTTDVPAAQAFYGQVVGWSAQDAGHPGMPYTVLLAGETAIGGLLPLSAEACAAGARPVWLGYVAVEDVDAAVERFAQAGGSIHREPEDIPTVGRFAVVADPQGAALVLFRGCDDKAPVQPPKGTPGLIGWNELYAAEQASAMAFYIEQFGWQKLSAMDMGELGLYQTFSPAQARPEEGMAGAIGGVMSKPPEMPTPPMWVYYFNVADIDAAVERVKAAGGQVIMGPQEVPGDDWIIHGLDPQGALFALVGKCLA